MLSQNRTSSFGRTFQTFSIFTKPHEYSACHTGVTDRELLKQGWGSFTLHCCTTTGTTQDQCCVNQATLFTDREGRQDVSRGRRPPSAPRWPDHTRSSAFRSRSRALNNLSSISLKWLRWQQDQKYPHHMTELKGDLAGGVTTKLELFPRLRGLESQSDGSRLNKRRSLLTTGVARRGSNTVGFSRSQACN